VRRKGTLGVALMLLLSPADYRWLHLILACDLDQRLAGFDLAHDLQLELTGKRTAFRSQGRWVVASFLA